MGQSAERFNHILVPKQKRAAVIGAGIIGLSTALALQDNGYGVSIYTELPSERSTSSKAAASFKPHEVAYNQLTQDMVQRGWMAYDRLSNDFDHTGVRMHTHWEASSSPKDKSQAPYLEVVRGLEEYESPHIPGGYSYGWKYDTYFIDTPIHLRWAQDKLRAGGAEITSGRKFDNLGDFEELDEEVIFNCTGLGARELCDDDKVIPIKGQIVLTDPQPGMEYSISADGFYVYPRQGDTVLGGTTEWNAEDESVENGAVHLLLRGNKRILPHLSLDSVRRVYAGLRPYRKDTVRVESEVVGKKQIIHNYGHGGSGYTLAYGSAELALEQL